MKPNDFSTLTMEISNLKHGGNVYSNAKKLNLLPSEIIDASASLVPFEPPQILIDSLNEEIKNLGFRYYPERNLSDLTEIISFCFTGVKIELLSVIPEKTLLVEPGRTNKTKFTDLKTGQLIMIASLENQDIISQFFVQQGLKKDLHWILFT